MPGKVLLNSYDPQFLLEDKTRCVADGIELSEEMLNWKFYHHDRMIAICPGDTYCIALRAMLALDGFTSVVSMRLNIAEKWFGESRRTFGLMFLGDTFAASFFDSFKAHNYDHQFLHINEWPGIDRKIVDAWTIDSWKNFFLSKIEKDANWKLSNEISWISGAQKRKSEAESILRHLGKLPEEKKERPEKPAHVLAADIIEDILASEVSWSAFMDLGIAALNLLKYLDEKDMVFPPSIITDVAARLKQVCAPDLDNRLNILVKEWVDKKL